ncbi:MAG: 2-oxoacid:acceptor oxidoreductase family protein [Candidatus Gracilibacteria bacterium]|nr:2-oxoacid:acceptor oxidoreductase family protein [Candidatus Gracilibacteria bacterium]
MHLNIRITGAAGAGVNSTVDIIAAIFARLGYDLITDIEYESRIKGGVNYFDVSVSDNGSKFLTKKVDLLLAFNAESLERQLSSLKDGATIIVNKKHLEKLLGNSGLNSDNENGNENIRPLQERFNFLTPEIDDKYDNTYLLGVMAKFMGISAEIINEKLEEVFGKKGEAVVKLNQAVVENIYNTFEITKACEYKIVDKKNELEINYGNKAIIDGATASGLEFYSAYPMTPASTLLTEVVKQNKVKYIQNEDEIAVVNSAIGASFTGARAMCGTSGGGFALMTEALSFAVQAEFPIVVVLAQRAGPSTGTPTYHEAGDLNFALNPTFGDFEHVVMYPSTLEESYYFGGLALNIADKYQTQVIFLTDKQAAELNGTVGEMQTAVVDRGVILANPPADYKRYDLSAEYGISPRVKVGTVNGDFIATSYEHDEYGATTENSDLKKAFTEKRWKKLENFFEREGYKGYEVVNPSAKKMLIVTSFTSYTAREFIKNNPEFGLIIIKFLKPLDARLRDEIASKEEIIFIESNFSGQLEKYITNEFGLKYIEGLKISNLRKYDLFPFYIEDFETLKK